MGFWASEMLSELKRVAKWVAKILKYYSGNQEKAALPLGKTALVSATL